MEMHGLPIEWDQQVRIIAPAPPQSMKDANTKTTSSEQNSTEMRAEYDFSGGVRGKYADRYRRGTNVVLLEPKLAEAFPDSKSVNDALRSILAIADRAKARKRA